jgi:hypothetical protein
MSEEWNKGVALMKTLEPRYRENRERMLDIGLVEAIGLQFASGYNTMRFYLMRRQLFDLSPSDAQKYLTVMETIVREEIKNSQRLQVLCAADSRLGFHSEAERHQYCGTRLQWRVAVLNDLLATEFPEYRAAFQAGRQVSRFAEGRAVYTCGSGWTDCRTYRWQAQRDHGDIVLTVEMKDKNANGSFSMYLCDAFATAHFWEINFLTGGSISDSRGIGPRNKPYTTPEGRNGVTVRVPSEGLLILDPSGRTYAFNIFNSRIMADSWPTGMDESDLKTYRLALGRFKPQKMGYLK